MKSVVYLAIGVPAVLGTENHYSFIPTLPERFSILHDEASTCNGFINNASSMNEQVKELTACSILQNHINLGITKPSTLPNGDVQNIKWVFNTTSIAEMLEDECFKMTINKMFKVRRLSFATTEAYLETLKKSYGVDVGTKGSYGAISAEVGYQQEEASVQSMTGVHSFSQAEFSTRVISATLSNVCMKETCENGKKCTERYLIPKVHKLVTDMLKYPTSTEKVDAYLGMYGAFLPTTWHYGASNFTRVTVHFSQESTAESETISRALNAAVTAVTPSASVSVEAQIASKYEKEAKHDASTTSLKYTTEILGPCGKVGFSEASYYKCLDILMNQTSSWVSPMEIAGYTTILNAVAADAKTKETLINTTYYAARTCTAVNGRDGAFLYQHPTKKNLFMQCGIGRSDDSDTCSFKELGPKTNTFTMSGQMSATPGDLEQGNQAVILAYLDGSKFGKLDRGHCHSGSSTVRAIKQGDDHCGAKHWYWRRTGSDGRTLCEDESNCVGLKSGQDSQAHIYHCDTMKTKPLRHHITGITKDFNGYPEVCQPGRR